MSELTAALIRLRTLNESVPTPARLPTAEELHAVEQSLGLSLHPDFRQYLLQASDVVYGGYELAQVTPLAGHTDLTRMIRHARRSGVPERLLPFCEDNGDYFCITSEGQVVYWSHNGQTAEAWPNLATWIDEVWLSDADDGEEMNLENN